MIIRIQKEADNQTRLWLAENGKTLKNRILDQVSNISGLDLLVLDFDKIEVLDTSYAREGFVKLVSDIRINSYHPQVLFKNVDEYVKQNLDMSFNYHKIFSLVINPLNEWNLIGKFSEQNLETVKALIKRKEASAKQISKDLGDIGLSTSINRLNQLYDFCVCTRKELVQPTGGKEYLFKITI